VILTVATLIVYRAGMAEYDRRGNANPLLLVAGLVSPFATFIVAVVWLAKLAVLLKALFTSSRK
jgi:hypothetical protein